MPEPSPQLKAQFARHASPHLGTVAAVYATLKIGSVMPALPRGAEQLGATA
jgi:hypothetical protein